MSYTSDELEQMLSRAQELPFGAAQIALVEQVVSHADAGGYEELAYTARMLANSAYIHGGEPAKALVTFARCLSEFDNQPRPFHQRFGHDLLWQFKWMVSAMTTFPEIPLARTRAVLDDMERRYREGGHSLHAVYAHRHKVAAHIGDQDEAAKWYEQWCAAPVDDLSDCGACDPSAKVEHLSQLGRDEEALTLAEPVVSGYTQCLEQPQHILTRLLVPYTRTGRHDEAVAAHRRAYRDLRGNRAELATIADHVAFCARTGNEVRGLELVKRHLAWLDTPPSPGAAMEFAAAAALLLRRLSAAGQGELTLTRTGGRETTVASLAAELASFATGLASRFDQRNGTSWQGDGIAALLSAEPLVDYLPLSPSQARPIKPETSRQQPARAGASPRPPASVPEQAGPAELMKLAVERSMADDMAGAEAALQAYDERFGESDVDPWSTAVRLDWHGMQRSRAGDLPGAVGPFREAASRLAAAGDELQAQATLSRLGAVLCQLGEAAEGLPLVEASAAYMAEHGEEKRRASSLLRLAEVRHMLGDGAAAMDIMDQAMAHAERSGHPHLTAQAATAKAYLLAELGRPEAVEAASAALQLYRPLGGEGFAQACLLYANLLPDPAPAVPVLAEAVAAQGQFLPARMTLAAALLQVERVPEALEEYLEAVALATENDDEEAAIMARVGLAGSYLRDGRPLEAAETGEEALAMLEALGQPAAAGDLADAGTPDAGTSDAGTSEAGISDAGSAVTDEVAFAMLQVRDECREVLMHAYATLGEGEAALARADELIASFGGFDHAANRGELHEFAGELLWNSDQDAEAMTRFQAAAGEYAAAGKQIDEVRARRRAMLAAFYGGDTEQARAALIELDSWAGRIGDEPAAQWEAAMVGYDGARLLAGDDEPEDAVVRLAPLPARFRAVDAFEEAFLADLLRGDLLLGLDRAAEAVPVLQEVTGGLPREHPALTHAAWLLATALESSGQPDAAADIRNRYGLEDEE